MKAVRSRLWVGALGAMLTMLSGCAVTGVGVDGGVDVGYVGGYYEPYGYDYGGWGGGYRVGPLGCCDHRDGRHDDRRDGRGDNAGRGGHAPAYRPAPHGRSAPSIPGRSRGH